MTDAADSPSGPEIIRDFVTRLPGKPGVYRMYDAKGDVIYVGKARNLKNRVSNYTRAFGHTNRIAAMISLTVNMEFVTTNTEAEALLLEANLIKKLKPRFNVVLRDDKSFPYILIARDHAVAQLVKHRGARNRKGSYFGPFASAGSVNRAINTLQKAFLHPHLHRQHLTATARGRACCTRSSAARRRAWTISNLPPMTRWPWRPRTFSTARARR